MNNYFLSPFKSSFFFRYKGGKGGGGVKVPPTPAPTPVPSHLAEEVRQKAQDRRRQRIAQAGRGGTILTEGRSLSSGQSTILGRSAS